MGSIEPILTLIEIITFMKVFRRWTIALGATFILGVCTVIFAQNKDMEHSSLVEAADVLSPETQIAVQKFQRDKNYIENRLNLFEAVKK